MFSITALAFLTTTIQGARVEVLTEDPTPCPSEEWTLRVMPRTFVDDATHTEVTILEREEVFDLPQSLALPTRAAIYEAPCPATARHIDGIATFNCEADGQWRLTKETCTHSSSDCFERTVAVTTEDGFVHQYPFLSGDDGARVQKVCRMGPWNTGIANFICRDGDWQVEGDTHCEHTEAVEQEIVRCNAEGGYRVRLDGETAEYALPGGAFGERTSLPCNFGAKTRGDVTFLCQESGDWVAVSQQCVDPNAVTPAGYCRARNKRVSIAGRIQRFPMPQGHEGTLAEIACENGQEGTASFTCVEDRRRRLRWRLSRHNCA